MRLGAKGSSRSLGQHASDNAGAWTGGCMALEASYASSYGHVSCSIASIGPSWHTCTCCALHQCQPFGGMQDGVELGAALRDATVTAGVSWPDMPAAAIESALRDFERRRSRAAPAHSQGPRQHPRLQGPYILPGGPLLIQTMCWQRVICRDDVYAGRRFSMVGSRSAQLSSGGDGIHAGCAGCMAAGLHVQALRL